MNFKLLELNIWKYFCNIKVLCIYLENPGVVFNTECSFTRLTTLEACGDILYLNNSLPYVIIASKDILLILAISLNDAH